VGIVGGVYGALYGYTYLAWRLRTEASSTLRWHDEGWFGARTYTGGADKLGHAWGNYAFVRGTAGLLAWGGYSQRASLAAASSLTLAFFLLTEIQDGYTKDYGFSWQDVVANLAGEGLAILLELSPALDGRFDFRLEYFPSKPFRDEVGANGPFNSPEDYTGQRYLLAYHVGSMESLRNCRYFAWTRYVDLVVGFHAAHYKPDTFDSASPSQRLFLGVSLNLQGVIERWHGSHPGSGWRAARFGAEIVQAPFTMVPIVGVSR
jgi:hypothetical protein